MRHLCLPTIELEALSLRVCFALQAQSEGRGVPGNRTLCLRAFSLAGELDFVLFKGEPLPHSLVVQFNAKHFLPFGVLQGVPSSLTATAQ